MSTLETQYKNFIEKNPEVKLTFDEWLSEFSTSMEEAITPLISDNFQIGPNGAYEHTEEHEIIAIQKQLIDLLINQVADLTMMSKIELGDDVIAEIKRLKGLLNK